MATGRIILPAPAWAPLDGSAGNLFPVMDYVQSSGGPPAPRFPRWIFDTYGVTGLQWLCVSFRMPADYASAPVFKWDWYVSENIEQGSNLIDWTIALAAITDGGSLPAKAPDTALETQIYANEIQNLLQQDSASITASYDDDLAADDLLLLMFGCKGEYSEHLPNYAYFLGGILEYTRT